MGGTARHLDGGNPLRAGIEYEGSTCFDLKDKQCRIKVEIHDGAAYGDLDYKADIDETTIGKVRELAAVNEVALPQVIVDRFNYTYPYEDACRRTAKISVSELKRRFQEREEEAGDIDSLPRSEPVERTSERIGAPCNVQSEPNSEVADSGDIDSSVEAVSKTDTIMALQPSVVVDDDALANSVFGRKPRVLQSEEDVLTGAQWGDPHARGHAVAAD